MPTLTTTKIFNIFVVLKGMKTSQPKCTTAIFYLDKAQLFNDYFHSVFSTSTDTPLNVLETQSRDHMLHINDIQFSNLDDLDLLTSLDTSKASGINSLSPKLFKFCAVPLLQIICHTSKEYIYIYIYIMNS